jgi:hypothetical protein
MSNNNKYNTQSPVLFLFFNRIETSNIVFNTIKEVRPKKLYLASDGARKSVENELNIVREIRNLILSKIDWECEVFTLFRDENLGCRNAVSNAISWFFDHEEQGIIIEDDCLTNTDFFRFCDEMLNKYQDNDKIGHISGINFHKFTYGDGDYYFSKLTHVWGWATWRRVWLKYDIEMKDLELFETNDKLKDLTNNFIIKYFMYKLFNKTKNGFINTWDYQYFYSNLKNNYISIQSNYNLVSNIGFDGSGTHTKDANSPFANMPLQNMPQNIKQPLNIKIEKKADNLILKLESPSFLSIFKYVLKNIYLKINK